MKSRRMGKSGRLDLPDDATLRCKNFLDWQCRLRQMAMRHDQGRPSNGCRPEVWLPGSAQCLGIITTLIIRRDPEEYTAQFRFMARKTHDPAERFYQALRLMRGDYYQNPEDFSDLLTALFSVESPVCAALAEAGSCTLNFDENIHGWRLPCVVRALEEQHPAFPATYWHNFLFNSRLPENVRILGFLPDWSLSVEVNRES